MAKFQKIVSVVLFMFAAMAFFCTKNASATTYSEIEIKNLDTPFYGMPPNGATCNSATYGGAYKLSTCRYEEKMPDMTWREMDSRTDLFVHGREYRMILFVKLKNDDDDYSSEMGKISLDGKTATDYYFTTPRCVAAIWDFTPNEPTQLEPPHYSFHATGYNVGYFESEEPSESNSFGWESYGINSLDDIGHYTDGVGGLELFSSTSPELMTIYLQTLAMNPSRHPSSEIVTIAIGRFDAPVVSSERGRIVGESDGLEYASYVGDNADEATWTTIEGNESTWLEPGVYYVRKKAAGSTYASEYVAVEVKEYIAPIDLAVANPETGDSVILYAIILVGSILGLVFILRGCWEVAFVVIYSGFLILDLAYPHFFGTTILKLAGILACFVHAAVNFTKNKILVVALGLTFLADLVLAKNNSSTVGIVIFSFAQLFHLARLKSWEIRTIAKYALIMFAILVAGLLLELEMTVIAVVVYAGILLANVLTSINLFRKVPIRPVLYICCGFILFLACDCCAAASYLSLIGLVPAAIYEVANFLAWVFYYPSQVFISNSSDYVIQWGHDGR